MLRKATATRAAKRGTATDWTTSPQNPADPDGFDPAGDQTQTAVVEPAEEAEAGNAQGPLTAAEKRDLKAAETVIERSRLAFLAMGRALAEIRERRLYRADYGTWEEYVRERWGFGRQEAADKIAAARVAEIVSPISDTARIPLVEDHLKALATIKDYEDVQAVYQQAVQRADREQVALTGKLLREELRRYMTPADELEPEDDGLEPGDDGLLRVVGQDPQPDSWNHEIRNLLAQVRALAKRHRAADRRDALAALLRNLAKEVSGK